MRLWSIHPMYLDAKGLVALWREALLAQAVIRGQTRGYRHHPQLQRFLAQSAPVLAITGYLKVIHDEASLRGYAFDRSRIGRARVVLAIPVTSGQIEHEWRHLLAKLMARDPARYVRLRDIVSPDCHPLFRPCDGAVEPWERVEIQEAASVARME